ncbi:hypothetical protein ACFWJ5_09580 [Streptomyces qaidamensis]|uniref:hypothetical protein n=1 Tax=Streptomyces qaidamensis TaxID=1783515 RepID=UPI00365D2F22
MESFGDGVIEVAPGNFVILNRRAVCGQCRACLRGLPWLLLRHAQRDPGMTLTDGTELSPALGIGAFAQKTLVAAGQCTKVDPAVSPAVWPACWAAASWPESARQSTPATSTAATASP